MAKRKHRGANGIRRDRVSLGQFRRTITQEFSYTELRSELRRQLAPHMKSLDDEVHDIVIRGAVVQARLRSRIVEIHSEYLEAILMAQSEQRLSELPPSVPPLGERLIAFFCGRGTAEAILGDLEEQFGRYAARWGAGFARRWYWWQAAVIGLRFGWRWIERLIAFGGALRRIIP